MGNEIRLLTDDQMRQFITDGYLLLKTDFPQPFHEALIGQLSEVYRSEGNPGNNLLPRIPQLQKVFDHPVVKGALTSVLGEGYMMHSHRHGHFNNSPKPGGWHKDSYWGYKRMRNHRPWWAMIMYFPQDTPIELGPTGVMPGTQNYETRTFASDESAGEVTAAGEAGTFVLIHYDIWHRSTANLAGRERFMLKFEFMRTQAPTEPSWDNREPDWATPASLGASVYPHEAMWEDAWYWMSGKEAGCRIGKEADSAQPAGIASMLEQLRSDEPEHRAAASDRLAVIGSSAAPFGAAAALGHALEDTFEPVAINAAYGLARMGEEGSETLLRALQHGEPKVSRLAAYGLSVAGAAPIGGLIAALGSEREDTVFHAAFALGEQKDAAASAEAVRELAGLLNHPSERLRCAAADALGSLGAYRGAGASAEGVEALTKALQDSDAQVRFTAGLSLAKWGARAEGAVPRLVEALEDENRYVRAHAAEALYYIGTTKAKDALLDFLRPSRWCPTTTSASTFYP
ncbi:phytanoyl-CoA dioxygenase [Paenibacillus hemerocallicola]|uniref:Phytanoyl-CoA dioxygenase n=1 Tax=Paenibacillus hemerocallicola TaxID=1172614 RepID=A0A5C4TF95_9BACL|nr:HEAT repeat domain-containing protein [Paenibacillus hemerocallicola]TNJ67625.1 phytanoyl-CoA dioxygenase [Paenibacillus hemerocallicola]